MKPPSPLVARVPRRLLGEIIDHLKAGEGFARPPAAMLLGPQVWTFQHRNVMIKAYAIAGVVHLKMFEVGSVLEDPDE